MRVGIGILGKFEVFPHIFRVEQVAHGSFRAGGGEAADQSLARAGQDLGISRQEAAGLDVVRGGHEAVDGFMVQIDLKPGHGIDDPGPGVGGLEGQAGIALGPGRGHGGSGGGMTVI